MRVPTHRHLIPSQPGYPLSDLLLIVEPLCGVPKAGIIKLLDGLLQVLYSFWRPAAVQLAVKI